MIISWAFLVLCPMLALVSTALSSPPFGLLPACFTRHSRKVWRDLRGERSKQKSGRIGKLLTLLVLRADRYRCVYCGARRGDPLPGGKKVIIQVDHIVPWIMGGLTALWNCAALCRSCNATKSCYWVSPSGTEYYRGRRKPPPRARLILAAELDARRSVARWFRAYGLLPAW